MRLNRPEKLNAFTFAMIDQIRDAVERAAADEGVVAIIITGTGRAFSAGLDAGDLAPPRLIHRSSAFTTLKNPTVAASSLTLAPLGRAVTCRAMLPCARCFAARPGH